MAARLERHCRDLFCDRWRERVLPRPLPPSTVISTILLPCASKQLSLSHTPLEAPKPLPCISCKSFTPDSSPDPSTKVEDSVRDSCSIVGWSLVKVRNYTCAPLISSSPCAGAQKQSRVFKVQHEVSWFSKSMQCLLLMGPFEKSNLNSTITLILGQDLNCRIIYFVRWRE